MSQVVYNTCWGGYALSRKAKARLIELGHVLPHPEADFHWNWKVKGNDIAENDSTFNDIPRHDPHLVQVVKELGAEANGELAQLAIYDIGVACWYKIDEYDGRESVELREDSWGWTYIDTPEPVAPKPTRRFK